MNKASGILSIVLLLGVAACAPAPPPAQGTPDDEVVIRGLGSKYAASFTAGDAAALAQMVTEDFENISADGVHTTGRAAFQKMEEDGIKGRKDAGLNLTLSASTGYVKWINATYAVGGGTYAMAGLPPGAPDKGAWIVVFKKSADGKWLMANSLVAEYLAPPPPPPSPDAKGKGK